MENKFRTPKKLYPHMLTREDEVINIINHIDTSYMSLFIQNEIVEGMDGIYSITIRYLGNNHEQLSTSILYSNIDNIRIFTNELLYLDNYICRESAYNKGNNGISDYEISIIIAININKFEYVNIITPNVLISPGKKIAVVKLENMNGVFNFDYEYFESRIQDMKYNIPEITKLKFTTWGIL